MIKITQLYYPELSRAIQSYPASKHPARSTGGSSTATLQQRPSEAMKKIDEKLDEK